MAFIYDIDNEYGARFIGDGGESAVLTVETASNTIPAISIAAAGNATKAPFQIAGVSAASGAVMGFGGGFISLTSVVLTTVANTDYAIGVEVNGVPRYIPLFKAAALVGAAAA